MSHLWIGFPHLLLSLRHQSETHLCWFAAVVGCFPSLATSPSRIRSGSSLPSARHTGSHGTAGHRVMSQDWRMGRTMSDTLPLIWSCTLTVTVPLGVMLIPYPPLCRQVGIWVMMLLLCLRAVRSSCAARTTRKAPSLHIRPSSCPTQWTASRASSA